MDEILPGREQDAHNIRGDWEATRQYMLRALQEVALDVGGEALAEQTARAAAADYPLPTAGFKLIEGVQAGAAERAMARAEALQAEKHQADKNTDG